MAASTFDSSAELILKVVGKMQKEDFETLHSSCALRGNHVRWEKLPTQVLVIIIHIGWHTGTHQKL